MQMEIAAPKCRQPTTIQKGNDCKECYQAEGIYFTRYFRIDWNQTKLPVAQIHLWTGGEENE